MTTGNPFGIGGGNAGAGGEPFTPLPEPAWPSIDQMGKIAAMRGIPQRFSEQGLRSMCEETLRRGWSQSQLESFFQHGTTTVPADEGQRNKGPYPILPQAHAFDAVAFEAALDTYEVEVKLANRAIRTGDAEGFDAHRKEAQEAAQAMDDLMKPDTDVPVELRMVNPRVGRAFTRAALDATLLAKQGPPAGWGANLPKHQDVVTEWASACLSGGASATIGLRSPDLAGQDDDPDHYAPFMNPFAYG